MRRDIFSTLLTTNCPAGRPLPHAEKVSWFKDTETRTLVQVISLVVSQETQVRDWEGESKGKAAQ